MEKIEEKFPFEPGDIIWVVERDEDDVACEFCGYIFVALVNKYVIVSSAYNGTYDIGIILDHQAAQTAIEGSAYLKVFPVYDCYETKGEAKNRFEMERGNE